MRVQEKNTSDELYDRLWKAKSARFNAYQRLSKTYYLSSYSTSLLSVYVIILSLLQPFKIITNEKTVNLLNLVSICVSVLLLVFVLMESSMQYNLKAEKFHDCAKQIGKLFKKFEFIKEGSSYNEYYKLLEFLKLQEEYDKIIDLYDNHKPIDFLLFQSVNKLKQFKVDTTKFFGKEYNCGNFNRWYIKFRYNHLIYIHYYFVIFILPAILVFIISILRK